MTLYLDHNAATPVLPEVQAYLAKAVKIYGNGSSVHHVGRQARELIESSRDQVAQFIGAHADQILFTGSATEANNQVLKSIAFQSILDKKPCHIIVSAIEHSSIISTCDYLAEFGVDITTIPVDETGLINMGELRASIRSDTQLISVIMASNEVGTVQPISDIVALGKEANVLVHTDAVQWVGKRPLDAQGLEVDFLTMSGHKIGGIKGVGVLFAKELDDLGPFVHGGTQERSKRAGTENALAIGCLGKALKVLEPRLDTLETRFILFKKACLEVLAEEKVTFKINGHDTLCMPHILNISFPGVRGESIMMAMDLKGIALSTGSACATGSIEPSHVLEAMFATDSDRVHGGVRLSFGYDTQINDIKQAAEELARYVRHHV